jgi:hypothetical protein
MQLRHPEMIGRWLPKQPLRGSSAVRDALPQTSPEIPETAVLHSVGNCPPLPSVTEAQGVVLNTDLGTAILLTTDSRFREQLFHTLQASLGLTLGAIGDFAIGR